MSASVFPSFASLERTLSGLFSGAEVAAALYKKDEQFVQDNSGMEPKQLLAALEALLTVSQGKELVAAQNLTTSKGKHEAVEEEGESGSSSDASVEQQQSAALQAVLQQRSAPLPPPPSALCDCHGWAQCPGFSFQCGICMDAFKPGPIRNYHSINCHTNVCDDCLCDQLAYNIRNGQVKTVNCPSCNYHLLPSEVARRLQPVDQEKYHRFLLQKLLGATHNLHSCPNPGCENAVIVEDECALKDWECEACSAVCSLCKQPAHSPGNRCDAQRSFLAAERRHKLWVAFSVSKKCPGCNVPIIKKGGCPHMTCRNPECNHQWCWHCKQDWSTHGTCVFTKVLLGVMAPLIVVGVGLVAVAAVAVAAPVVAAGAFNGNVLFKGKAIARVVWRKGRRFVRNL